MYNFRKFRLCRDTKSGPELFLRSEAAGHDRRDETRGRLEPPKDAGAGGKVEIYLTISP